jgi:hypothetical protein
MAPPMKNFRRSLQYLWPYRVRIGVGIACVILIAGMWGGSLGMVLPGAKILISDEGLHGWAYMSAVSDRLGCQLIQQKPPPGTIIEDSHGERIEIATVLNVVKITDPNLAKMRDAKFLSPSDWIVGLQEGHSPPVRLEVDPLLRRLADYHNGQAEMDFPVPAGRGPDDSRSRERLHQTVSPVCLPAGGGDCHLPGEGDLHLHPGVSDGHGHLAGHHGH